MRDDENFLNYFLRKFMINCVMEYPQLEFWNCQGVPVIYRINTPDYYFLSACVSFMKDTAEIYPFPEFFKNGEKISYDEFKSLVRGIWESQSMEYNDDKLCALIEQHKEFKPET